MNINTVAIYSILIAASSDAAFLRSGVGVGESSAAAAVCSDGQIYVVNNCGATLKHCDGKNTKTIQAGCQDLLGAGQRIWVGSDDSNCYSQGNTLFEYTYGSRLSWDVSLLTGYNYPVKVENDGRTLLDVTGPSCGGVRGGLFPCTQKANTCVEGSSKWQPICEGCNESCCDTSDQDHDCNPPDIYSTQNMVLTFCPNQESFFFDADTDAFIERERNTVKRTTVGQAKNEGVYLASDAVAVDVTVTANVKALQTCVNEDHPVTVFYSASDRVNLSPSETITHSIIQDGVGLHFGIQVNDWYWRSNANPYTGQWSDNAGMEVIIKNASTCDFELTTSWGDSGAPDARDVLDLTSKPTSGGCSFTVTRKATPSLHITKGCAGPCKNSNEEGCACIGIAGGNTDNCPTEN